MVEIKCEKCGKITNHLIVWKGDKEYWKCQECGCSDIPKLTHGNATFVNATNGICKTLLSSEKKNPEFRMGMKHAEDLGIDLSDESIIKMFEKGIFVDIVIRKITDDDYLPVRLEKIQQNMTNENGGSIKNTN